MKGKMEIFPRKWDGKLCNFRMRKWKKGQKNRTKGYVKFNLDPEKKRKSKAMGTAGGAELRDRTANQKNRKQKLIN